MVVTINGKDYKLHFGIGFVRALDEKYNIQNASGAKFGLGLSTKVPMLIGGDPVTLSELIYEGMCTEEKRPTQKEVDAYIDNTEDMDALFGEVLEELKKQNATRKTTLDLIASMKEEEEKRKAKEEEEKR